MSNEYLNRKSHDGYPVDNGDENGGRFRQGERGNMMGNTDEGKRQGKVSISKHESNAETFHSCCANQEKLINPYSTKMSHAIFNNDGGPTTAVTCVEKLNMGGKNHPNVNFSQVEFQQNSYSRRAEFREQIQTDTSLSFERILHNPYKKTLNSNMLPASETVQSKIVNPYHRRKDKILYQDDILDQKLTTKFQHPESKPSEVHQSQEQSMKTSISNSYIRSSESISKDSRYSNPNDNVAFNVATAGKSGLDESFSSTRVVNPYTNKNIALTKLSKNENSKESLTLQKPGAHQLPNNYLDKSSSLVGPRNPYNLTNSNIFGMESTSNPSEKEHTESQTVYTTSSDIPSHTINTHDLSKSTIYEKQSCTNSSPNDAKNNFDETKVHSYHNTVPSSCGTYHHEQTTKVFHTQDTIRPFHEDFGRKFDSNPSRDMAVLPSNQKIVPTSNKPKLPPELEYDETRCHPINDEYRLKLIKAADLGGTLKNGWKLLPHQKVGILKAVQMRRLILAYDMGLGKTLIGCVYAKAFKETFPNLKVYVIAPVTLKKEWERTATEIVGLECEVEKKGSNGMLDQESLALRITSWSKVPLRVPPNIENFVVICDEAHNLQSMESARTKDTLKLVLAERCIGCLLLTGTPMKNGRPSNLFPLLRATRHPFGDDQKLYEFFFCNGQNRRYGNREVWDASGSSNLALLNAHITSHILHKTKDDCLNELPEKIREYKTVPVGSKYEIQHNRALNELVAIYNSFSDSNNDESNDAILGAFARLRQIAAFAKIDATVALAKEILQTEPSIVIFTCFVAAAKELHRKLESAGWTGELLAGETPSAKRQKMIDNFQDGIKPAFIGTFGAAGVGITLTAARTIILMDRPWTPGDALQAEDRVRRIGQTKSVRSIWIRAFNIDEQVDSLIEHKSQNASSVVEKNPKHNDSSAAPRISIKKLVETIVADHNVK